MEISFAIWLLRQSRGMSQTQLAARMRTTRQQVSDLEIGQAPTIATLCRVARALKVTPAFLVLIAENRRRPSDPMPRNSDPRA
jgi:transcriptional regulator with XRE-family HTH domain